MRCLAWFLSGLLALPLAPVSFAQTQAPKLNLVIVEGEGAINNIRQRTAREPVVQVEDENHKPVAGAVVLFTLPTRGATAEFPGGAHSLSVTTDAQGRAVARGLQPNSVKGPYQMQVSASYNGLSATATISATNVAGAAAGAGAAAAAGISGKVIAIIAVAAAAAAGGAYAATHTGGSSPTTTTTTPGVTISAGTGSVGPPR